MDLDDVFRLLETATRLEKDGQRIEASTKYYEGCHLMRQIVSRFPPGDTDPVVALLQQKIQFYTLQAQRLYFDEESVVPRRTAPATITVSGKSADDVSVLTLPGNPPSAFSEMHRRVGLGNARLERAINLEEANKTNNSNNIQRNSQETIIQSYTSAAEAYLSVVRLSEESSVPLSPLIQSRLEACLDRIEALKYSSPRKPQSPSGKGFT